MKRNTIWILAASLALLVMGCENEHGSVAVESVTFIPDTLMLGVGDISWLTVDVEPWDAKDRLPTLESSDPDVAKLISYDQIAAVGEGTAIITAKAGGKQATCEVIVHIHSWSDKKCTKCGVGMYMKDGTINDEGVLTSYYGKEATVVIPEGVMGIGKSAFYDNKDIESVTIPGSIKNIESRGDGYSDHGAFEGCTKLKTVTMVEGVESIGNYAFNGCTSLSSVKIPTSVTSIGGGAFSGCTSLMEIQFEGTKEQWNAIEGSKWVNVTCIQCSDGHIGVKEVPEYLTMSGTEVTGYTGTVPASLVIPEDITGIKQGAFKHNMNIESVTIADSVKSIGSDAFKSCTKLTKVTMGKGVESIGSGAFYGCTSLKSVTIPESVTSIGYGAFEECTNLASVTYKGTFAQWCAMGNDSYLMSNAKTVTIGDINLKTETELTIPDGVESIGNSAFYGCTSLKSVTIPASVTSIGGSAFNGCTSFASVTIPASVTSIGGSAFYGCTSLKTVNYGGTEEEWKKINRSKSFYFDAYNDGLSKKTITGKDGSTWKAE